MPVFILIIIKCVLNCWGVVFKEHHSFFCLIKCFEWAGSKFGTLPSMEQLVYVLWKNYTPKISFKWRYRNYIQHLWVIIKITDKFSNRINGYELEKQWKAINTERNF